MTPQRLETLRTIAELSRDGDRPSTRQIAAARGVSQPATVRICKALVASGHLRAAETRSTHRPRLLLTEEGHAALLGATGPTCAAPLPPWVIGE